jgi:hypothetical protein
LIAALWRSVLRRRKIAPARTAWTGATAATASTTTPEASASAAVTASIRTSVTTAIIAAIAFGAAVVLSAAIVAWTAIIALRIFLRRIVVRSEILWGGRVRFRLALFEFVVRLKVAVGVTALGANFVSRRDDVPEVVMLVVIVMFVVVVFVLFAVRLVTSFGVSFAVLVLVVMFFAFVRFRSAALTDRLAGQDFGRDRRGNLCRAVAVRITVAMAVIVVLEIFENVADVQEGVAVETDIDEGGLHTG